MYYADERLFIDCIDMSHHLFKKYDYSGEIYSVVRRWVEEWFSKGRYTIRPDDRKEIIHVYIKSIDQICGCRRRYSSNIVESASYFILKFEDLEESSDIGLALMPYLFSWNLSRFIYYIKKAPGFHLDKYIDGLRSIVETNREQLERFRTRDLLIDPVDYNHVNELFKRVSAELTKIAGSKASSKGSKGEAVMAAKLLHMIAPSYFPLLDNPIARGLGLREVKADSYVELMNRLKQLPHIYPNAIEDIKKRYRSSVLKLVDEALFVLFTKSSRTKCDIPTLYRECTGLISLLSRRSSCGNNPH